MIMNIISFVPFLYSIIKGKVLLMFQNGTTSENFQCHYLLEQINFIFCTAFHFHELSRHCCLSIIKYSLSSEGILTVTQIVFSTFSKKLGNRLTTHTVFSLLNALGVYKFFLILGWASIGEGR